MDRLIDLGDNLNEYTLRGRMVTEYKNPTIREVFEGE